MRLFISLLCLLCTLSIANDLQAQKKNKSKKESSSKNESAGDLEVVDACQREQSVEKIRADITPYRFDKVSTTKVFYKPFDKSKMVAIPLYHTTGYKFIVNSEGMPTAVTVKISDKPLQMSGAKVLHESTEKHFSYEPPSDFDATRIYVTFIVPADKDYNNGIRNKGCILIGSGYKNLDF